MVAGRPAAVRREWRANGWRIPAVAILMTTGYPLVLLAFESTQVSYVAPVTAA
jgi:hypothetical protein